MCFIPKKTHRFNKSKKFKENHVHRVHAFQRCPGNISITTAEDKMLMLKV